MKAIDLPVAQSVAAGRAGRRGAAAAITARLLAAVVLLAAAEQLRQEARLLAAVAARLFAADRSGFAADRGRLTANRSGFADRSGFAAARLAAVVFLLAAAEQLRQEARLLALALAARRSFAARRGGFAADRRGFAALNFASRLAALVLVAAEQAGFRAVDSRTHHQRSRQSHPLHDNQLLVNFCVRIEREVLRLPAASLPYSLHSESSPPTENGGNTGKVFVQRL